MNIEFSEEKMLRLIEVDSFFRFLFNRQKDNWRNKRGLLKLIFNQWVATDAKIAEQYLGLCDRQVVGEQII